MFVAHRANLFGVNARLHPVLAAVIVEMTELNRHRRAPDLPSLIRRLENYRDQTPDIDVAKLPGLRRGGPRTGGASWCRRICATGCSKSPGATGCSISRPSQATLNLTVASVPMVMNLASMRLEQLFVWHPATRRGSDWWQSR